VKPVLYNPGGYVAHVSVKIDAEESFDALVVAAGLAREHGGLVERLYEDSSAGQRTHVLGTERAGLVLEPGTFQERDEWDAKYAEALKERDRLRAALHEVHMQATRKERASGLKRYLETDLEIIARVSSREDEAQ
jgi:hypothetical protein